GVARQSEEEFAAGAAEDQGLAGLNENPIEEKFGAQVSQHGLDQVVLAGRDSAGEKQQIHFQSALDSAARGFILVFRDGKNPGFAAGPRHLRQQRIYIGIPNLKIRGLLVRLDNFVAGRQYRNTRLPEYRRADSADGREKRDRAVVEPPSRRDHD